jgi:adenylate kinase
LLKIIIITGTPGTGKTSLAKRLSEDLHCTYINTSELALKHKATHNDPTGRDTLVIEEDILVRKIKQIIDNTSSKCIIIDTHYPSILRDLKKYNPLVLVLRATPETLVKRLEKRGWRRNKILENAEAELLGIVDLEARSVFPRVYSIDTTERTVDETLQIIHEIITDQFGAGQKFMEQIDWLEKQDSILLR